MRPLFFVAVLLPALLFTSCQRKAEAPVVQGSLEATAVKVASRSGGCRWLLSRCE